MKLYEHMPQEYFVDFVRAIWFDGYDLGYDKGFDVGKDWANDDYGYQQEYEEWVNGLPE